MLKRITLKFGSSPGQQPLVLEPGPTTVFVGPNNSGKSLVLVEAERVALGENPQGRHIVDSIDVTKFSDEEARALG